MTEPAVLYEQDGSIALITLNRSQKLNAIDMEMPGELRAAVERANSEDSVHVIVLSGAGRAFSSGYDLELYAERPGPNLVSEAVPAEKLDGSVEALAKRIAGVPKNQLMMQKMVVNQAYENMGLATTQMLATFFDGIARHSPEGVAFKKRAEEVGFKQAVAERDSNEPI